MKKLLVLATLFAILFAFLNPVPASAVTTQITIWHTLIGPNQAQIEAIWADYAVAHPGLTITAVQQNDLPAALDAASDLPDLILTANDRIGPQADKNRLRDLDSLGVTTDGMNAIFQPAAVQGVQYKGKFWGFPFLQEGIALVYNKDLVTAAYLPTDPLDFAALRAKAQAFQTATGKPLICNQGFPGGDSYHVAPVFFGFGLTGYVGDRGEILFNRPAAAAAAEWLASMPSLSPGSQTYDDCQAQLLAGNVGMWWTGPWAIANLETQGLNYGIASMGRPFVGIQSIMLTTAADAHGVLADAYDLMVYTTNTANSKTFSLANHTIPANTAALNDPAIQALPSVQAFGAAMNLGIPMSPSPAINCAWVPINDAVETIWEATVAIPQAISIATGRILACEYQIGVLTTRTTLPMVRK